MNTFIEKYPQDDKIYFAFDSIGQTETNRGNVNEAIAAYSRFVEQYPAAPKALEALLKVAELQRTSAERLGRYARRFGFGQALAADVHGESAGIVHPPAAGAHPAPDEAAAEPVPLRFTTPCSIRCIIPLTNISVET